MCKSNSGVHFCTCSSVKQIPLSLSESRELGKAEYERTHYLWSLYRYIGGKESLTMGQMILPVESLGENLTSENLLNLLHSGNNFDFDYSPTEGDNLQIRKEYVYQSITGSQRADLYDFMSFNRDSEWKEEVYDVFSDKIRKFKTGIIKSAPSE